MPIIQRFLLIEIMELSPVSKTDLQDHSNRIDHPDGSGRYGCSNIVSTSA
jgi:hypothetical protein